MKKSFYYVIDSSKETPDEIRSKLLRNRQKLDLLLQNAPGLLNSKRIEAESKHKGKHFLAYVVILISTASFCCIKKLKKMHLFSTEVAKSCISAQTFLTTVIYSGDLFTYNAIYLKTLLGEKWRSLANSLPSMLKLRSSVHEVESQLLHPIYHWEPGNPSHMGVGKGAERPWLSWNFTPSFKPPKFQKFYF